MGWFCTWSILNLFFLVREKNGLNGHFCKSSSIFLFSLVHNKHIAAKMQILCSTYHVKLYCQTRNPLSFDSFHRISELNNITWIWRCSKVCMRCNALQKTGDFQPDVEDTLVWKWTQHGLYSSSSAYRAQFLGSYINHKISLIWWARTENKYKFFAWVLIQNKLLTSDNLARHGWPHQPSCALCNGPIESGLHLCLTCPFTQEVWNTVLTWESFSLSQQVDLSNISSIRE
jgi:hypothetical protein